MQPGQMLAHYRVEEKIGAGGMGEVYRAHDTTLGRDVALKILPPEFAADTDRLARFEREARLLASLNHPDIAAIYGFETTDEVTFLAMELVEGEDLSAVIERGPVPVDEAVAIARQIAEGLEEAHEKGIVHRDLKPANVKIAPDGKVKVLDFGLARAFAGQTAGEGELSSAPTMTAGMTQAGTVLGTAAYMSPEQARGKEVDRRTDIWAFGVILFEMLTGKRLFAGETASDILAGILKVEPDWDTLPEGLPHQVERVLRRCLLKDPRQRLRDIGEARVRLENPEAESGIFSGALAAVDDDVPARRGAWLPWGLLAASLAVIAWLVLAGGHSATEPPALHLAIPAPEEADFHLSPSSPGLPAISPDGRHVVFSGRAHDDGAVQLYVRARDAGRAVALDGTENAQYPFWSPDGQWIGFFDAEGLKKVMVGGGPTQLICKADNAKGGTWNADGQIVFAPVYNGSLHVVPDVGGQSRPVTDLAADEGFDSHRHPQFLPDGRQFLYFARGAGGKDSELRLASLDDDAQQVVTNVSAMAQYASGHLLFLANQTLMAQPFDPVSGRLDGTPVPLAENVLVITGAAKGAFSASEEGTVVYLRGRADMESSLVWLDRGGKEVGVVGDLANYDSVILSPDNRRAVATVYDQQAGTRDLWIVEIGRDFRTRFTNDPADESYPVWMSDGRTVLFCSDRGGQNAIYRQQVGGPNEPELVFELEGPVLLWDCADDDRTILYSTPGEETALDLWAADLAGETEPRLLWRTKSDDAAAKISPDGRWILFWSTESGTGQDYLAPWPAMTPVSQVSTDSGTWAWWSGDGDELLYKEGTGRIMAVTVTPQDGDVVLSAPQPVFDHATPRFEGPLLDLAADGQRFLSVNSGALDPPGFCDLVMGWPGRVARR